MCITFWDCISPIRRRLARTPIAHVRYSWALFVTFKWWPGGKFFALRSSTIVDGSLGLCGESEEVCEQINRTIFYVLSLRRTRRAGCLEITESITSSIWDRGDLYMKRGWGREWRACIKGILPPQAAWCPLRLYLWTPDWVRYSELRWVRYSLGSYSRLRCDERWGTWSKSSR